MKKLLITAFDPFGGATINPAWEAVRQLPDQIGNFHLTKLQIPTRFGAAQIILDTAHQIHPHVILCIGQAGGRSAVTPELVAINLREARIPDNAGFQPVNCPVVPDGPAAYFSTVPVREMVHAIRQAGIPTALSSSAGLYVCNDVLYTLLHHFNTTETKVGFIHVPSLPEQVPEHRPSLSLEKTVQALTLAIEAL